MKSFLSISFLIHFAFLSVASALFSDFKSNSVPAFQMEVTLYPWKMEAQEARLSVKKVEEPPPPVPSPAIEAVEPIAQLKIPVAPTIAAPSPQIEDRQGPVSKPVASSVKAEQEEMSVEVAEADHKPIALASLNPEKVLTNQKEESPQPSPDPSQTPPVVEEMKPMAKHFSSSEDKVIVVHPRYAENPRPLYPREARKRGFHGEVVLRVEVLPNGLVGQVELKKSSGHEILDRSALSAVKEWKFFPAKKGETAVPFWVNIPIKFQLQ